MKESAVQIAGGKAFQTREQRSLWKGKGFEARACPGLTTAWKPVWMDKMSKKGNAKRWGQGESKPSRNMRVTSCQPLWGPTLMAPHLGLRKAHAPLVPAENYKGMTSTSLHCLHSTRSHVTPWVRGQGLVSERRKLVFKPAWVGFSPVCFEFLDFSHISSWKRCWCTSQLQHLTGLSSAIQC